MLVRRCERFVIESTRIGVSQKSIGERGDKTEYDTTLDYRGHGVR